jgi:plasmid segregation protein ParM
MHVLGLDIGYSNVKMVFGEPSKPTSSMIYPAGAGRAENFPREMVKKSSVSTVTVDGELWVCGVNPSRFEMVSRVLHEDYPATKEYKALFYSALARTGYGEIDVLVTGLPVDQYLDDTRKKTLESMLVGEHQVGPKRKVVVQKAIVIPQPIGAYLDMFASIEDDKEAEKVERSRVLTIDPGFFSLDWVMVRNHAFQKNTSSTSKLASSIVLEEVATMIKLDFGCLLQKEDIEDALQQGLSTVLVGAYEIDYSDYLKRASAQVAEDAMKHLLQSLRTEISGVNIVLLSGGGANFYRETVEKYFPKSKVMLSADPVLANANGFFIYGEDQ